MKPITLILRRELGAYLRSPLGWVVAAVVLFIDGLLFNVRAIGGTDARRLSAEVLQQFFENSSGCVMAASVILAMRLLAEERQNGTIMLLHSSPVREYQIVLGKFLSAFVFLGVTLLLTIYMPMLVMVHGKIAMGHVLAGYLGLLLLAAASLSIGLFASSLTGSQVIAAILGAGLLVAMLICWLLGLITDRPLNDIFTWLALWNKHFRPFMTGLINTQDVVYYVSVTYFFLFASTRVLESRRWSA